MNVEAFNDVIASVEKRPEERFAMGDWRCGTVCCAWGSFVEKHGQKYGVAFTDDNTFLCRGFGGWGWGGFSAASEILGIPYEDAMFLFNPGSYVDPTKAAVLARLRKYLAEHGAAVGN